jgi:hypothetical protein
VFDSLQAGGAEAYKLKAQMSANRSNRSLHFTRKVTKNF